VGAQIIANIIGTSEKNGQGFQKDRSIQRKYGQKIADKVGNPGHAAGGGLDSQRIGKK